MPLPYETAFDRFLERPDVSLFSAEIMGECWYRPRELLVHEEDYPRVEGQLGEWTSREMSLREGKERLFLPEDFPIRRFELESRMNVPAVARRLRQVTDGLEPRVAPNHVFGGLQGKNPFPASPPIPTASQLPENTQAAGETSVAVLDTGITLTGGQPQPWFGAHATFDAADEDPLDVTPSDGMIDDYSVHGTFVAGVVLQHAPGVVVRHERILLDGIADDLDIAAALATVTDERVVNMSFGGDTLDNLAPPAIEEALERIDPSIVMVAAAGNYGRRRPCWPAAFKRVIAVGAVDESIVPDDTPQRAPFSNYGWWVDACAHGVDVLSTFCEFNETGTPNPLTYTGFARWSGTSFAAPKVAAKIAKEITGGAAAHEAVYKVVGDPALPRIRGLGTWVR